MLKSVPTSLANFCPILVLNARGAADDEEEDDKDENIHYLIRCGGRLLLWPSGRGPDFTCDQRDVLVCR